MVKKLKTLSLIIPVYNEQDYLGVCLDSIAAQSVMPLEVIVVDNNSTDMTVEIAESYDFVRVIKENRQHQSYAQHTGFSKARGELLGRIDADTILPVDWVEKSLNMFEVQPDAIGFSGSGFSYDIVLKKFGRGVHSFYFGLANWLAGTRLMWGSNCVFKASAWHEIKDDVALRNDIWEDYDLGFCLGKSGRIEKMDNDVEVSYRSIHRPAVKQILYQARSVRTFRLHRSFLLTAFFALSWSSIVFFGPVALMDYYVLRPARNIRALKLTTEGQEPF